MATACLDCNVVHKSRMALSLSSNETRYRSQTHHGSTTDEAGLASAGLMYGLETLSEIYYGRVIMPRLYQPLQAQTAAILTGVHPDDNSALSLQATGSSLKETHC